MSIKYMTRVWATQELKHGRLLLMLALADHANDAGECWPSQPHLEEKTRLTERQLRRVIGELCKDGFLAITEKGVGRGKKTVYKLFPEREEKADILSETKADIISKKADKMSEKSGQNVQRKADIISEKADIFDANQSHARSEPPIEPTTKEPSEESSSTRDDDDAGANAIEAAWLESYGDSIPERIAAKLPALVAECGEDAVVHGIRVSVNSATRSFKYIAESARNFVPPAAEVRPRYSVDIPGVIAMSPAPQLPPDTPKPLPASPAAPLDLEAAWQITINDMCATFNGTSDWVAQSSLHATERYADGKPIFEVHVSDPRHAEWLEHQAGRLIRRSLSVTLQKPVVIEFLRKSYSTGEWREQSPVIQKGT